MCDERYYITEAGDVLGVTQKLGVEQRSAKHVLTFIFNQLCNFKRLNFQVGTGTLCCRERQLISFFTTL